MYFSLSLQRPACQSTLFHAWETFLQEVEADSQSTSELSNLLSKQVSGKKIFASEMKFIFAVQ
jgi:hypothetical protein